MLQPVEEAQAGSSYKRSMLLKNVLGSTAVDLLRAVRQGASPPLFMPPLHTLPVSGAKKPYEPLDVLRRSCQQSLLRNVPQST